MSKKYDLKVSGMTCASCVARVEKVIGNFDGIKNVSVNLATEIASFETDDEKRDLKDIAAAIKDYGYELKIDAETKNNEAELPAEAEDDFYKSLKNEFIFALILTIPVFLISMLMDYAFFKSLWMFNEDQTRKILLILTTPIIFISGKRFFKIFWNNLRHFSAEMNSLVAIGTGSAFSFSVLSTLFPEALNLSSNNIHVYYDTTAVIITLILMGKLLEHRAKNKTNSAIKKLLELKPKTARILIDGTEVEKNISLLQINDVVVIKPGEKIPADGIIIEGNSSVDESMLTGESLPLEKEINSEVYAGTINKNGTFNFRVTKIGDNSILGQIIKLVESAQASKPPIQKIVDKIAGIFVPIVIVIAIVTFIGWTIFSQEQSFNNALINFVAVLIVACPCALGLATPTAIIVGTGLGASNGILIRNGESIELAHKIKTIIFDKTGTITEGKPIVSDIITFDYNENDLLFLSASLESKSEHPLAKAIIEKAKSNNISLSSPEKFQNHSGFGISGIVNNKLIAIGNIHHLKEFSTKQIEYETHYNSLSADGKTVAFIIIENELKGIIGIEDKLKETSREAISSLNKMKIKTVMLTGDNKKAAESIAKKIGISDYKAEVLPQDKSEVIKKYQSDGSTIAMVGDGINDAPALAQADVSIAIGTGTDVAIESSQITLVKGDLRGVVKAINLSNRTLQTIKQNLFWAFIYNTILIPLAAIGLLNPMIASLAMSLSSVSVVTNSLRLKKAKI